MELRVLVAQLSVFLAQPRVLLLQLVDAPERRGQLRL